MRLLVTETRELAEFIGSPPAYAILSHRWRQGEVTLPDLSRSDVQSMEGYSKLSKACEVARDYGFEYLWMGTCCIDQKSSVELSESINSAYKWYNEASICFAYLDDVLEDQNLNHFSKAEWFSRGWTLQELIAPAEVLFFGKDWSFIGTKASLAGDIKRITGIEQEILIARNLEDASAAKKMSWASERITTKVEDEAYCLLGLFGVNMAAVYGEGRKAFTRLQEEILKTTNDHSIFAWGHRESFNTNKARSITSMHGGALVGLMAKKPSEFKEVGDVIRIPFNQLESGLGVNGLDTEIMSTSKGLRLSFPIKPVRRNCKKYYLAYLACGIETRDGLQVLAIILELQSPCQYARIPGTGSATLLEIPYDSLISSEVHVDDRAYMMRDTLYTRRSSIDIDLDITSLHVFCKDSDFLVSANFKWTALGNRWTEESLHLTGCSFKATVKAAESYYLVLRHRKLRLGLIVVIGTDPSRYAKGERHIFYTDMCPIGNGAGCIPYQRGRNIFRKTLRSWKLKRDLDLKRSIVSSTTLPNGLSIMSMIIFDKEAAESGKSSTNPYMGISYKLSVRAIKPT